MQVLFVVSQNLPYIQLHLINVKFTEMLYDKYSKQNTPSTAKVLLRMTFLLLTLPPLLRRSYVGIQHILDLVQS